MWPRSKDVAARIRISVAGFLWLASPACTHESTAPAPPDHLEPCEPNECVRPFPSCGANPVHGTRADGRVDVTAAEAWPDRPPSIGPSADEAALACEVFASCAVRWNPSLRDVDQASHAAFRAACLGGGGGYPIDPLGFLFSLNAAQRMIPLKGSNESWPFLISSVLEAKGDCRRIQGILTPRAFHFDCQEDGCQTDLKTSFKCQGDVATAPSVQFGRDCSRSGTHCSETSSTGCTDRAFVRCSGGMDRCDGDIKLGCDSCGFVSYRDCSWNGGHCSETSAGAGCVPAGDGGSCVQGTTKCNGARLDVCFGGQVVGVDCGSLGFGSCITLDRPDGSIWAGAAICDSPNSIRDGGARDASADSSRDVDASASDAR